MSKFKKGDRVKLVGSDEMVPTGSTGTVKETGSAVHDVKWDKDSAFRAKRLGRSWPVSEYDLELIDAKSKFKVGDTVKIVDAGKYTAQGGSVIGAVGVIDNMGDLRIRTHPIGVQGMVPPPPDGSGNMDWFTEDALELVASEAPVAKSPSRRYKVGDKVRILDKATYLRVKEETDCFDEVGDPGEENVKNMDALYGTVQEIAELGYTRAYYLKGIRPGVFYDKMFDLSYTPTEKDDKVKKIDPYPLTGKVDMVNSPPHYTEGGIECIKAIEASLSKEGYKGFLKGNVMKYLWRYEKKIAPLEDIKKAQFYLNALLKALETE